MKCFHHPEREAFAFCMKYKEAYCQECCSCRHAHDYCKFRTQCLNWQICSKKNKERITH